MKKVFYIGLLSVIVFTSCTDGKFKLSPNSVSIYYGKEITVKAEGAVETDVKWSTFDDFYADVDSKGKITGCHVGNTDIVAQYGNKMKTCNVEVLPLHTAHSSLHFNWGDNMSSIRSILGTPSATGTASSGTYYLIYKDRQYSNVELRYGFENGKLEVISVVGTGTSSFVENLTLHLKERYAYIGESNGLYMFVDSYKEEKISMAVVLGVSGYNLVAVYMNYKSLTNAPSRDALANSVFEDRIVEAISAVGELQSVSEQE